MSIGSTVGARARLWPGLADAPTILALAAAYAALSVFGLSWAVLPGAGTPIWPASGLAFAFLVLGGLRLWPAIVLGRVAAAVIVQSPQPLWADVALGAASAFGGVLPAWFAITRVGLETGLSRLRDILVILAAAVASSVLSAGPGLATLWLAGAPADRLPAIGLNWVLGNGGGVLLLAPPILAWAARDAWRRPWSERLHLAACLAAVAAAAWVVFLSPLSPGLPTWYLFPLLVWPALAFNVRGASLALLLTAAFAVASAVSGSGTFGRLSQDPAVRLLYSQQFVAIIATTVLVLAATADERRGRRRIEASEARLREESRALETLNATGAAIAAELDLDTLVQTVTDAGVALTGAQFGAFFYTTTAPQGDAYTLYCLSGAPREAFAKFDMPRATAIFAPTFEGQGVVRSDDITRDPRYGHNAPHRGMPEGHLPVRSYLAVPVKSRSGAVLGGLFFGHPDAGRFSARSERIATGIATQATIALDNAHLYKAAQTEIADRQRAEAQQHLLINELNHRVKNTLATVQSLAVQSLRGGDPAAGAAAFIDRILALARAHDVITARTWQGADVHEVVDRALEPFRSEGSPRVTADGPSVWLSPRLALALSLALHELATNAVKHGALSNDEGHVALTWRLEPDRQLRILWSECGGPPVATPTRRGFGARLLERSLSPDFAGGATLTFAPAGVRCEIVATLPEESEAAS